METPQITEATISEVFTALFDAYKQGHVLDVSFAPNSASDHACSHLIFTFKIHITPKNVKDLQMYLLTRQRITNYILTPSAAGLSRIELVIPRDFLPKSHPLYEVIETPNYYTSPPPPMP